MTFQIFYCQQHCIYRLGRGSSVVIIQARPGIGQATLDWPQLFVAQGFSAYLPHLFGPIAKISLVGNVARVFACAKSFIYLKPTKPAR
jgi:hypothetical protein